MTNALLLLGRAAGLAGLLLCLFSSLTRLSGVYSMAGFEMLTFLQGGIGGMVLGCFFLLLVLTRNAGQR